MSEDTRGASYRCAIVGVSGGRARGHADAFRFVTRGSLVAISTRTPSNLQEFGDEYGIDARYTDYRNMFENEELDLVLVNTPPTVRLDVLEAAEAAGVRSVVVEKPIAVQGEDYRGLVRFAQAARLKVAVNHQLHFHPRRQLLQRFVRQGRIGDVQFVEASSGMNLAYQGTHSLQAIGAFLPDATPVSVFGQVGGTEGLTVTPKHHYAPDESLATITYDSGVTAVLRCGRNAPRLGDRPVHQHKRIAVYGREGYVNWSMWDWHTLSAGRLERGEHEYAEQDVRGQAGLTEAMFDWIENDDAPHPLRLKQALVEMNIILGLYQSALERRVVDLPDDPPDDLVERLRREL